MFDLARADAERKRTKRAMRARVTIATNDRHTGPRQSELWPNDVNDALLGRVDVVELNAKLVAVSTQCLDLIGGRRVSDGQTAIGGGNVVIDGAESEIRASHFAACLA